MRLSILFVVIAGMAEAGPRFEERSQALGLTHQYTGDWEFFVGGGVAVFDCNNDKRPEVFVAGGAGKSAFFQNYSFSGVELRLTPKEGLDLTDVTGAYPIDIDGDHLTDLVVLRAGQNRFFRGLGDCKFEQFTPEGIEGGTAWTTAFSATWEEGQSSPSLAFGNYVDRNDPNGPFGTCDGNDLYRPNGGKYEKTSLSPAYCTLSLLFSDWGRLGRQDLRVSNDRHYYVKGGQEQMWAMEPQPRLYSQDDGWEKHELWGMGIASRDISGDGRPEVMLTSMGDQRMQRLAGRGPHFEGVGFEFGTSAHRPYTGDDGRPSTGWHAQFGDVNNDGRDDLFISKGNVEQIPGSAMADPNNLLIQGVDGTFEETGLDAGIATMERSRGAAVVDLNRDGRLDLVVVNRRASIEIYENITEDAGNWIAVELSQDGGNTHAVGAWIEVRSGTHVWHREVTIGGGHAGGQLVPHHFGLGEANTVEIRVAWPHAEASEWIEFKANQLIEIVRN